MEYEKRQQAESAEDRGRVVLAGFNKTGYTIPDLGETIKDLHEMIREEEQAEEDEDDAMYSPVPREVSAHAPVVTRDKTRSGLKSDLSGASGGAKGPAPDQMAAMQQQFQMMQMQM